MAVHRVTRQSGNKRISLQQRGSARNTNNYAPRSRFLARCANRETAFKRSSSHKPLVGFVWRAGRQTSKHENKRANNGSEIIKRPDKQRFPRVTLKRWKKKNETRHESESRFLRVNFVIATEETTSFTIISFFISYFALQFFLCPTFHHPRSSFLLFVERIRFSVSYPLIPFSNVWFSPPIVAIIPFHPFVIFFFVTATLLLFIFSRRFLHCLSRIRGYSDKFWVLVSSSLYSRSPCLPSFLSSPSLSFISSSRFWSLFLPFSLVY